MRLEEFEKEYPEFDYYYYVNFNYDLIKVKNILEHYDTIGKDEIRIISHNSFIKYNPEFNYYYFFKKYEHFIKSYLKNNINQLNICLTYCFFRKLWNENHFGLININNYIFFYNFYRNYYTNLLDYKYYFINNTDLIMNGIETYHQILDHWLNNGIREGRIGSINYIKTLIDYEYYLKKYPDLKENGINTIEQAFKHYITIGKKENREINYYNKIIDLDLEFYKTYYKDLTHLETDNKLIEHYAYIGTYENRFKNENEFIEKTNFDWEFYVNYHKDLNIIDNKGDAINHYINCGINEEREYDYNKIIKKYNFDYNFYIKYYDDLNYINNELNAIKHFLIKGLDEGRYQNSSKLLLNFNIEFYKNYYKDIKDLDDDEIKNHYIFIGSKESRIKSENEEKELIENKSIKIGIIYVYYERKAEQKNQTNLSFFIKYGLDRSRWRDMDIKTLIIINGHQCEVLIPERDDIIILKEDNCSDWEGWYNGIKYLEKKYKKPIYESFSHLCLINASCFGPVYEDSNNKHWLDPFLYKLKVENSVICSPCINFLSNKDAGGPGPRVVPHFSVIKIDKKIIDLLCYEYINTTDEDSLENEYNNYPKNTILGKKNNKIDAILTGEYGLSIIILKNNYNISCLIYDNLNYKNKNIWNNFYSDIDRNFFNEEDLKFLKKQIFIKNVWRINEELRDSFPFYYKECINFMNNKLKFKNIYDKLYNYNYNLLNINTCGCININRLGNNSQIYNKKNSKKIKYTWDNKNEFYNIFGYSEEFILWPKQTKNNKSIVIYCHYDKDNIIKDYVINSLKTLIILDYNIMFCTTSKSINNVNLPFKINYFKKKKKISAGNDFYMWYEILSMDIINKYEWVLCANDSILLPIHGIDNMKKTIDKYRNNSDFWGLYLSNEYNIHLCSCFIEFNKTCINKLINFYKLNLHKYKTTPELQERIECQQTEYLVKSNFKYKAVISYKDLEKSICPLFNPINIHKYLSNKELFGIKWKYLGNYIEYEKIDNHYLNYLMRYLKTGDKIPNIPNYF